MTHRKRGRPAGSGINDSKALDAVADLMIRDPEIKKTPAIRQIVEKGFQEHNWSAVERRLLRKWNASSDERLSAARERRREERAACTTQDLVNAFSYLPQMTAQQKRLQEIAVGFTNIQPKLSPEIARIVELHEQMRESFDTPQMQQLRRQTDHLRQIMSNASLISGKK